MGRIIKTLVVIFICFIANCVIAGTYNEAWDLSLPVPSDDPMWGQVKVLWEAHFKKEDVEELIEPLKTLQNKYPDRVEPCLWLGKVYYLKGKLSKKDREVNYRISEDYAAKALGLDKENALARKILMASASSYQNFETIIGKYLSEEDKTKYASPVGRALPEIESSKDWNEAMKYWDRRENIEDAKKAVALFKKIAEETPENSLAKIWVTRGLYYVGYYYTSMDEHDKGVPYYKEGNEYGRMALELDPYSVPANYWRQLNLARSIQTTNIVNKARNLKPIMNHLVFTANENPSYFYNGPVLSIATIILKAGWVAEKGMEMAGYTMDTIMTGVNLGVITYPTYIYSHFAKAEVLSHMGKKDEAIKILHDIEKMDPYMNKYHAAENMCAKRLAKKFLEEIQ